MSGKSCVRSVTSCGDATLRSCTGSRRAPLYEQRSRRETARFERQRTLPAVRSNSAASSRLLALPL